MNLTSIKLIASPSASLKFDMEKSYGVTPYLIRGIIGLDADEIVPKFYGFSRQGDKRYYDFSLRPRDVVIRLVLNPRHQIGEDISYLRDLIYRTISATRTGEVELQLESGAATVAHVYGHFSKLEVAHFSEVPELQMTIRCNDPMLRSMTPTVYEAADFPSLESMTVVDSESTSPHGLVLSLRANVTLIGGTTLYIQDKADDPEWQFIAVLAWADAVEEGDTFYISSELSDKQFYREREGEDRLYLMDTLQPGSIWPIIFPGFNYFHIQGSSFDINYLMFTPTFWGV